MRLPDTKIPTRLVGPIAIKGNELTRAVNAPLATLETPLWYSVGRGAKVTRAENGLLVTLVQESMTRSVLFETQNAKLAVDIINQLPQQREHMQALVSASSRFTRLVDWHTQIVGNLIFIRFSFKTGGAAGHNMATKAAEILQIWLLKKYPQLRYLSVSGNYCADKKNSAVNGILGRGKYVIAELTISREVCSEVLRVTPEQLVELNLKKNLIGSIIAGGVRTANAHFANMLLAFYLATGQDAANIVEGSQGITQAEVKGDQLYFAVTLPNLIVGAVGGSSSSKAIRTELQGLEFMREESLEQQSRILAVIAAATVWCGELSLLAAQCNPGELVDSHLRLERGS